MFGAMRRKIFICRAPALFKVPRYVEGHTILFGRSRLHRFVLKTG